MTLFAPPHRLNSRRWRGMRVGILGGSFNPPHAGHIHISETAIKRLDLDCVWWMIAPQNPLKTPDPDAGFEKRLNLCHALARNHPRIIPTDIESQLNTKRTFYTLKALKRRFPHTEFVFIIGSDLVPQFPRWTRWRDIPKICALAILPRPPALEIIRKSALGTVRVRERIRVVAATQSNLKPLNIFTILNGPTKNISSTNIRISSISNR